MGVDVDMDADAGVCGYKEKMNVFVVTNIWGSFQRQRKQRKIKMHGYGPIGRHPNFNRFPLGLYRARNNLIIYLY